MIRTVKYEIVLFEQLHCCGRGKASTVSTVFNRRIGAEHISDRREGASIDDNSRI